MIDYIHAVTVSDFHQTIVVAKIIHSDFEKKMQIQSNSSLVECLFFSLFWPNALQSKYEVGERVTVTVQREHLQPEELGEQISQGLTCAMMSFTIFS